MPAAKNPQLYVKSYFAASVRDAIETAREEMGADALFLNSRPAPAEARHLGELEIVFGTYIEMKPVAVETPREDDDLRLQIDELRSMLLRKPAIAGSVQRRHPLMERLLLDAGADAPLAMDVEE